MCRRWAFLVRLLTSTFTIVIITLYLGIRLLERPIYPRSIPSIGVCFR